MIKATIAKLPNKDHHQMYCLYGNLYLILENGVIIQWTTQARHSFLIKYIYHQKFSPPLIHAIQWLLSKILQFLHICLEQDCKTTAYIHYNCPYWLQTHTLGCKSVSTQSLPSVTPMSHWSNTWSLVLPYTIGVVW